jgi:AcrR family transcriptional regulator
MKKVRRTYVLKARAERAAETRARIVDAIMHLHGEVGPRATTVSAIAERAGVERLTVYRHFSGEDEMFAACSHRYLELNPPPRPDDWTGETDPVARTQAGLAAIFAFFSRTAPMFSKIYRDEDEFPILAKIVGEFGDYLRSLADGLALVWPADARRARRIATLRHAVKFQTWQTLESDGLSNNQKVHLLLEWIAAGQLAPGGRQVEPAR